MRTFYIYKSTNKLNGKSYIGQTVNYRTRVWQHRRCYEKEDCKFHEAIQKYGFDNFDWEVLETCQDFGEAIRLEKYYIEKFDSCRNGYNMNKGGVGGFNARAIVCLTLDGVFVKRYDSAEDAEKEDGFYSSDVLVSCKNKHRTCKKHIFMFEDEYLRYGAREYIKPGSEKMKTIIQCDKNGNFMNKYKSVQEASQKTNVRRSTISGVLTGTYKSAGGYIFVYEKDFPVKDLTKYVKRKKGRKIAQVDIISGEIIKVFDRISDAGKELGVSYKSIHKVVDLPDRTAYGYKWISQ